MARNNNNLEYSDIHFRPKLAKIHYFPKINKICRFGTSSCPHRVKFDYLPFSGYDLTIPPDEYECSCSPHNELCYSIWGSIKIWCTKFHMVAHSLSITTM